jgi:hypothetical protein
MALELQPTEVVLPVRIVVGAKIIEGPYRLIDAQHHFLT